MEKVASVRFVIAVNKLIFRFNVDILVLVIVRCRVQYGKYFPSFSYFATYFTTLLKNVCQYCTRQRAIITLSLNVCLIKMYQELSYLLILSGLLNIV